MHSFVISCLVIITVLVTYIIPFAYAFKKGVFLKGVMFTWILNVTWGFLVFIISMILLNINENTKQFAIKTFPEMNALPLVGSIGLGWLWGIIITSFALGIKWMFMKLFPPKSVKENVSTIVKSSAEMIE